MHEYSIVQALIDRASEEARKRGAVAVKGLSVRLGALAGVEPDLLKVAYEAFRERTLCADASLDIRRVEALWRCPACGRSFPTGAPLACPDCRVPARLAQGDEIFLDRIEMEVA